MAKALWLADVLRDAGLDVVEHDGWQDRGRPGDFTPKGVLLHHTASNAKGGNLPALATVRDGRADLPGPLSQLMLARDGTWHVIAAGRCNHAGKGKWRTITNGNRDLVGVEAENDGRDEVWSAHMMESYVKGANALRKHMNADPSMVAGHKEYALPVGRKVDPTFDCKAFRDRLAGDDMVGEVITVRPALAMLQLGAFNSSVRKLQQLLGIKVDGDFGPATKKAVEAYQRQHGLVVDGKVGPVTWASLLAK